MVKLRIDGLEIETAKCNTVLEAARQSGAEIPAMCDLPGYPAHTSCMVCLVKDIATGGMFPSCSVPVRDGMDIDTCGEDVVRARRGAVELLLTEHVGDCEGPCRLGCPARMDIPLMTRQIAAGDLHAAAITVKRHIALPAVLGRICPAPCERVCRRREVDEAISICMLKRFVGDWALAGAADAVPDLPPGSGCRVAIVGAGPTGLSAAYYLQMRGHACTVIDEHELAGGMLRYGLDQSRLPVEVLDAEIAGIRNTGVVFRMNRRVDSAVEFFELRREFDAVVFAAGETGRELATAAGLGVGERGVEIDRRSFLTNVDLVFAGGAAVAPTRLAVRAVAHGREIAMAVSQAMAGEEIVGETRRFNSRIGHLEPGELQEYASGAVMGKRVAVCDDGSGGGYAATDAQREVARCLHCDCRMREDCLLRMHADGLGARQARGADSARPAYRRFARSGGIIFEQGKCIRCGRCVRITEKAGEPLGLAFINRGFDIRVAAPFDAPLEEALGTTAAQCVSACPTGALAMADETRGSQA